MASKNYRNVAAAMVDPQFNSKLANAKEALNTSLKSLDDSKLGVNRNYDNRIENNTLQNRLTKNNASNRALGTGMARSTIAQGDLGSIDLKNTRETGDINEMRTGDLNQIESQKSLMNSNYANNINALKGDRESAIMGMAEQLRQRDEDVSFRNRQLAQQASAAAASRAQAAREFEFRQKQFDADQQWKQKSYDAEMSKANQIDPYSDKSKNAMTATYLEMRDSGADVGKRFLQENKSDIVSRYGYDTYTKLMNDQKSYEEQLEEERKNSKSGWTRALQWVNPFDGLGYND